MFPRVLDVALAFFIIDFKANNGGPQWYSEYMMWFGQPRKWHMFLKQTWDGFCWLSILCGFHEQKRPGRKIIKTTTGDSRHNILPPVVALRAYDLHVNIFQETCLNLLNSWSLETFSVSYGISMITPRFNYSTGNEVLPFPTDEYYGYL